MKLGTYKKMSPAQFQMIQLQYKDAMKTCMDHFSSQQMRTGKYFERNTADNRPTTGGTSDGPSWAFTTREKDPITRNPNQFGLRGHFSATRTSAGQHGREPVVVQLCHADGAWICSFQTAGIPMQPYGNNPMPVSIGIIGGSQGGENGTNGTNGTNGSGGNWSSVTTRMPSIQRR
jgi:hypothetical protein